MTRSQNLLYEIGVEEIPSEYIPSACDSIREKARVLLAECGYGFSELFVLATPRRFVISAENFKKNAAALEERFGPSKEQSFQNGNPTPAFSGFLKSVGKSESDIEWKETPKGVRALIRLKKEAKPLKHFFETLPFQIEFPKLMRWEKTNQKFVRPIRWTFAVIGSEFQSYKIGDVKSGNFTYGHRFLANKKIKVANADLNAYAKLMQKNHVVLCSKLRTQAIEKMLKPANNQDADLIHQVADLTEEPFVIQGSFKKEYLNLPAQVLATCMKKHQKIFACYDSNGKLENRFMAVINGKRSDTKIIARNYENVLISRLEDAKFFYQEDLKSDLKTKTSKLKDMIFLGKLGSYLDKTKRLKELIKFLADNTKGVSWFTNSKLATENQKQDALKAAEYAADLLKADLTTHLVYEFPELQGIAGSEYAKRNGENQWVVRAIKEHYYPLTLSQDYQNLKGTMCEASVLLSLADRIDLLVGALGIGIEISGSKDPYALRRAAGGIVKLIRAFQFSFLWKKFIHKSVELYGSLLKIDAKQIETKLESLFEDRMIFELALKPGTRDFEIFKAVFRTSSDDLAGVYERFNSLKKISEKSSEDFMKACKVVERTSNILKNAKNVSDQIDPSKFEGEFERKLHELLSNKSSQIESFSSEGNYEAATKEFGSSFYGPLNDFFDKVMVNVPDEKVRANRQALMKKINRLYTEKIADLALITNQ